MSAVNEENESDTDDDSSEESTTKVNGISNSVKDSDSESNISSDEEIEEDSIEDEKDLELLRANVQEALRSVDDETVSILSICFFCGGRGLKFC